MMSKPYTVIFLLFSVLPVRSQNLDSLKEVAAGLKPYQQSDYYNKIGIRHYHRSEYDSAIKYFGQAAFFAEQNGQFQFAGQAYNNAGVISYSQGDYRGAILNYGLAIDAYTKSGENSQIPVIQINLGLSYKGINLYRKALDNLYEGVKPLDTARQKRIIASAYNAIGNIHRELGTMDLSIDYLNRALTIRRNLGNKSLIGQSLHNIGIWYFENGDLIQSRKLLFEALEFKTELDDEKPMASTLAKLGEVYIQMDSLVEAEDYLNKSYAIRKAASDSAGMATGSNHLARLFLLKGDLDGAEAYLKTAQSLAEEGELLQEKATSLMLLQDLLLRRGDYRAALDASTGLAEVNEAILNTESAKYLIESEVKFDVYQKDQEIFSKQIQLNQLQSRNRVLFIVAVGLIVIATVITLWLRATRKVSAERRKAKERVEGLLSELNHRTKNHLQAQSGLIKQQLLKLKDNPAKAFVKDIDNQIKAINLIHQSLYDSTEEAPESIDLTSYVRNIVENLMISFGMTRNQIDLVMDMDEVDIDVHKALPVGLIVNESVTNAFKHAFGNLAEKRITVKLQQDSGAKVTLTIADNGGGFDGEATPGSTGMKIMKSLSEDLSGNLQVDGTDGTTITLVFMNKK